MGYPELIEALKQRSQERLRELETEALRVVDSYRKKALSEFDVLRNQYLQSVRERVRKEVSSSLFEAKKEAKYIRTVARNNLAGRLLRIAEEVLKEFRDERYEEIFKELIEELPPLRWTVIRVNPLDRGLAGRYFPDAKILEDDTIVGGLVVETEDGIRVDNTFHKRLERLWLEVLPHILREVKIEK